MATKASVQKLIDEKSDSVTLQDPKGTFIFLQYVFALYLHNDHVNWSCLKSGPARPRETRPNCLNNGPARPDAGNCRWCKCKFRSIYRHFRFLQSTYEPFVIFSLSCLHISRFTIDQYLWF